MSCTFCLARVGSLGAFHRNLLTFQFISLSETRTGMAAPCVELATTPAWVLLLCLMRFYSAFNYLKLFRASKSRSEKNVLSTSDLNAVKENDACHGSCLVRVNLASPNHTSLHTSLQPFSNKQSHPKIWSTWTVPNLTKVGDRKKRSRQPHCLIRTEQCLCFFTALF